MSKRSKYQLVMKSKFRQPLFTVAATALLLVGPAHPVTQRSKDPKLDKAIAKANAEFIAAMKTGDAVVIAAPYTDRAVFVAIDGACTQGRSEIEKMYQARFDRSGPASSTKINSKGLVIDGDLAYESGYAEIGSVKQGKLSIDGGRFLTVWQRQTDGEWKVLRNIVLP
jgi:uncharacterized protein (TIGR02246 family)